MSAGKKRERELRELQVLRDALDAKTAARVEKAVANVLDGTANVKDAAMGFGVPLHRVYARVREERAKAAGVVT